MTNKQLIDIFHEIAELLTLKNENRFKILAYQELAQFLIGYASELYDIYKDRGKSGLMEIPHIGEGIAKKIVELFETGKLEYLEELKAGLPEGLENFLKIPGMGPKTAVTLAEKFKIKTVVELENLLREGSIRDVKGFGIKTEVKLLKGLDLYKKGLSRKIMGVMRPAAEKIIAKLKTLASVKKAVAAGSMRRMEETVGDIDILAVSTDPKKAMDLFTSMDMVKDVISKGEKKSSIFTEYDIQADLRVIEKESYGAALQYFTGSKEHNVQVREIAAKKGYKLNEYGLFTIKGKRLIAAETEEEIYEKLGMQYIPPELRTGGDEIKAAQKKMIPELVELKDIKGDLHCHTKHTDGANTLEEMVEAAKERGYGYIAVTNHSQSLNVARGLKPEAVLKLASEVKAVNKKGNGKFTVLMGGEVDILADGAMDYPDEILGQMDIVVASVHSHFKMGRDEMTARIMKAMENKYVNIIGHVSGRLINSRDPYELDYPALLKQAAKTSTAMEINCQPDRLDLKDIYVREAIGYGVKLAINTDAHEQEQLGLMIYGVGTARRGWAVKKDIINTWDVEKLRKWIKIKRK
jgi:DNA polymerase (family 10)